MRFNKSHSVQIFLIVLGIIALNRLSNTFYWRFDLTPDKRLTLSQAAKNTLSSVNSPLLVEVFLKGNFPPEFKRLQEETQQILTEFSQANSALKYNFINPLDGEDRTTQQLLQQNGMAPAQARTKENGKISEVLVYPWAVAHYNGKSIKISLLKNQLGSTSQERVENSIQNLEYAFAQAFKKLLFPKKQKIAILKGNGELDDKYLADFISNLREHYYIGPFTLDSVAKAPKKSLKTLQNYDLIIAAQPTQAFTETEKYVLDQYIMKGGKSLWLIDAVAMDTDSLLASGKAYATYRDLNLTDFFFKYGLRISAELVNDIYSAPIVLASGNNKNTQYNSYPWFYSPLSSSANRHPITNNIEAVKFEYATAIDTLPNAIKKTVLLSSSPVTKLVGIPKAIDLAEVNRNLELVNKGGDFQEFKAGEKPLALLLEGSFSSVFKNRVKPIKIKSHRDLGLPSKMVVISDGDVIKNQLKGNKPLELGYDKRTKNYYGNKYFLLNTVNYLLDDTGLINIRSKKIKLAFLDPNKAIDQRNKWQIINILLPLILLFLFGLTYTYYRKRKYGK